MRRRTAAATAIFVLALSCWIGFAPTAQAPATAPPRDLDAYVARVLKTFDVPGASIAIVKDGSAVLMKGFGVKKVGEGALVDERTRFAIGSNTKVFTAAALGLLVEEGKLAWDAPVVRYLPAFQMWDPYVTRELTIRDLLVHRSGLGLGAGDLLWWPASTYTRKEIVARLRFVPLTTSFRSAYAYDNVLYLVAGEVIEAVSGRRWEDFVGERILKSLGMTTTTVRYPDAVAGGNLAMPHAPVNGIVVPVKPFDSDNVNPAGGITSNAVDMATWMLVLLGNGRIANGFRLFSAETAGQLTTLVTPMPIAEPAPQLAALKPNFCGYALGLRVQDYRGHKILTHTGGLPGYVSRVLLVPDANLGVTVLTNQESEDAFDAIAYALMDHYLGTPRTDWIEAHRVVRAREQARVADADARAATARKAVSKPSLPLTGYTGIYTDAWYGDIAISVDTGKLTLRFTNTPVLVGDLEHFQYDTFIARWQDRELRADAYVTFALNSDGSIDQVKLKPFSESTDFSFDFQDLLLKPTRQ
jgi:CubicO group peptidase (beta-lactamase class C family)